MKSKNSKNFALMRKLTKNLMLLMQKNHYFEQVQKVEIEKIEKLKK